MAEAPRGRPRAEPRPEQHDRIVRVARAAFTEHGYDGVTMANIARAAAVPRPVVYEVVGSKEQLLAAVANQVADELIDAVDARFAQPSELDRPLEDVVRDDIRWFIRLIAAEPAYPVVMRRAHELVQDGSDLIAQARHRFEDRIADLHTARGRALGVERVASARVLSVAVVAMIESIAVRLGEPGWPADAVADLVGEFAAGGYLRTEMTGTSEAFDHLGDAT